MKKITVHPQQTTQQTYPIFIGSDILTKLQELIDLSRYSKAAIITDTNVAKFHLLALQEALTIPQTSIVVPPGEKEKTIRTVEKIWEKLAEEKMDRKSIVFNLGGGVIGDMGGFAAGTFMRGIDFINIPTTILAQVDESVGGKTGIDFAGIKNIIGTFQQPTAVIIDINTVQSLPDREFNSGFAEIIKHGLIADKNYFEKVTEKTPRAFTAGELETIIAESCEIKRQVVEDDTTESGRRKTLNFGHTIGHAIEAIRLETESSLLHGEAVSLGILAEAKISQLKNYITENEVNKIKSILHNAGLPVTAGKISKTHVLEKISSDKKNIAGKVSWTLLKGIGSAVFDQVVTDQIVDQAVNFIADE